MVMVIPGIDPFLEGEKARDEANQRSLDRDAAQRLAADARRAGIRYTDKTTKPTQNPGLANVPKPNAAGAQREYVPRQSTQQPSTAEQAAGVSTPVISTAPNAREGTVLDIRPGESKQEYADRYARSTRNTVPEGLSNAAPMLSSVWQDFSDRYVKRMAGLQDPQAWNLENTVAGLATLGDAALMPARSVWSGIYDTGANLWAGLTGQERNALTADLGGYPQLDPATGRTLPPGDSRGAPASAGLSPNAPAPAKEFSAKFKPFADAAAQELGVDPLAVIAQAGLETDWGRQMLPGTNNPFNITAVGDQPSVPGPAGLNFRVYDSITEATQDYAELVKRRYPDAVGKPAPEFFKALQKGGYAGEDAGYAENLTRVYNQLAGGPAGNEQQVAVQRTNTGATNTPSTNPSTAVEAGLRQTGGDAATAITQHAPAEQILGQIEEAALSPQGADQQVRRLQAMQEILAGQAQVYLEGGNLEKGLAMYGQMQEAEAAVQYADTLRGLMEADRGATGRIQAILSRFYGSPVQVQKRTDGNFQIGYDGGRMDVLSPEDFVDQAQMMSSSRYRDLVEQARRTPSDPKVIAAQINSASSLREAMIKGRADVLKALYERGKLEFETDGEGRPVMIGTDENGQPIVFRIDLDAQTMESETGEEITLQPGVRELLLRSQFGNS